MSSGSEVLKSESVKSLQDAAFYCIKKLEANNFEAYVVGGTVRDILLERTISDLDLATSALPEEVHQVFSGFRVLDTGIMHGTVTLLLPVEDKKIFHVEITTYRVESAYSDARHPDTVEFTKSIEKDLARRDLTINAMAWHPEYGILDPYGGRNDLKAGILRAVGLPEKRYEEDALRILRTLRFAAELGFAIEENTEQALLARQERLARVAPERLSVEFFRLITAGHAGEIIGSSWQVIAVFLKEFNIFSDKMVRERYLPQFNLLPAQVADRLAYLAAIFRLRENLASLCNKYQKNCPDKSTDPAASICQQLKCSKKLANEVLYLSKYSVQNISPSEIAVDAARQDLSLAGRNIGDVLLLKELLGRSKADIDVVRQIDSELDHANLHGLKSLEIDGKDLIELGFEGEAIGIALNKLYRAVLCKDLMNRRSDLLKHADILRHSDS